MQHTKKMMFFLGGLPYKGMAAILSHLTQASVPPNSLAKVDTLDPGYSVPPSNTELRGTL